jgi:hypothetical protein
MEGELVKAPIAGMPFSSIVMLARDSFGVVSTWTNDSDTESLNATPAPWHRLSHVCFYCHSKFSGPILGQMAVG